MEMASCSGNLNSPLEMKGETVKIFKFYENVTECHLGENMRWKCRLCESKISSSKRATSNLITHIQRKHPSEFASYQREKESTKVLGESRIRNLGAAFNKYITMFKYSENDIQQVKLNYALSTMVADNLLPFSFVESEGFRSFMNVADPKYYVPSEKDFDTVLVPNHRKHLEDALRDSLKQLKQICVSLDVYACGSGHSYVVMMAHLVEDWNLKSVLLACRSYEGGRHDSENVVREYEEVVELFQIRNKVRHIVTDSALYRIRAADVFVPFNGIKRESNKSDVRDDDRTKPVEIQETDLLKQLPERMKCFACALQLVVKDCFRVSRIIFDVFSKVTKLMIHLRSLVASDDTVNFYLLAILPDVADNWNAHLKAVRGFLKIPDSVLNGIFQLTEDSDLVLSAEERTVVSEFLDVMEPFEEAMDQINGQQMTVTVSNVVPCIRGLKLSLRSAKVNHCCELVSHLSEAIEEKLSEYEHCDTFIIGSVVDPRFKMDWCSPDEVLSLQTILFEEMKNAVLRDVKLLDNTQKSDDISPEDLSKRPKLFRYMSESLTTSFRDECNDTDERIAHEITHYLASKCVAHSFDPLLWWKGHVLEFPILASIARNVLSVCSSSTMVERVLDHELFDIPRRDITNEQFETLVFIKCNSHLG